MPCGSGAACTDFRLTAERRWIGSLAPMTDYALATNLYSYAQVEQGFLGWPVDSGEAQVIRQLRRGDVIVPKFAAQAAWEERPGELDWQRGYCAAIGVDYDTVRSRYNADIAGGNSGVPFILHVGGPLPDDDKPKGPPWACVAVEVQRLEHPLSTKELLLLRALPISIAAQFKGIVSPGRHLQELPPGTAEAVLRVAQSTDRGSELRRYSVVEASDVADALKVLEAAGRTPLLGDRVFIVSRELMLGVYEAVDDFITLHPLGAPIRLTPSVLLDLFAEAITKARPSDQFNPSRAIVAATQLHNLLDSADRVLSIDDFARFHDRYNLLASKVTLALEIARRPSPSHPASIETTLEQDEEAAAEADELDRLHGLTIEAVRQELPPGFVLSDSVLAEAVTALRAGKHLLLGGPPGTGKSTLAEALCRAVVGTQYDVVTATADWTTFDTIGGYMPADGGALEFEPGVILRSLQQGHWLTIDELNRADIDKAFGPLFTLLAGAGAEHPNRRTLLPFRIDKRNVEVRWGEQRSGVVGEYVLTPGWRLIGTLNLSDKATLFKLSFAFLRRFAVIDVPLPSPDPYRAFVAELCAPLPDAGRDAIVDAAVALARGPRELGPAILYDIATFMIKALAQTSTGAPTYDDAVTAFVTAVRLFAVPQYEGATPTEAEDAVAALTRAWPARSADTWASLRDALAAVALA